MTLIEKMAKDYALQRSRNRIVKLGSVGLEEGFVAGFETAKTMIRLQVLMIIEDIEKPLLNEVAIIEMIQRIGNEEVSDHGN